MKIHTYEKAFLGVGLLLLVACSFALVFATMMHGIHLPGETARIHPAEV